MKQNRINIDALMSILQNHALSDEESEELQKVIYGIDDGNILVSPFKLEDTVYLCNRGKIIPASVTGIEYTNKDWKISCRYKDSYGFYQFSGSLIGENVFRTREEAETIGVPLYKEYLKRLDEKEK